MKSSKQIMAAVFTLATLSAGTAQASQRALNHLLEDLRINAGGATVTHFDHSSNFPETPVYGCIRVKSEDAVQWLHDTAFAIYADAQDAAWAENKIETQEDGIRGFKGVIGRPDLIRCDRLSDDAFVRTTEFHKMDGTYKIRFILGFDF